MFQALLGGKDPIALREFHYMLTRQEEQQLQRLVSKLARCRYFVCTKISGFWGYRLLDLQMLEHIGCLWALSRYTTVCLNSTPVLRWQYPRSNVFSTLLYFVH